MDITRCSLAELVDDPLIGLVMRSDGVDRCELARLLERVAREPVRATGRANLCQPRLPATEAAPCSHC